MRDSTGQQINLRQSSIEEARNSSDMRELRLEMLAGKRPAQCSRCWTQESLGIRSRRAIENNQFLRRGGEGFQKLVLDTDESGKVNLPPSHLDLRFSNKCNLACRMCSPNDSSLWEDEYRVLQGILGKGEAKDYFGPTNDWHENKAVIDEIAGNSNLRVLLFTGGEPLIAYPMYDLLERLIKNGHAQNIRLEYNSNMTVLPDRVFELWSHFKSVDVHPSIEGIGQVNDYVRHPSKWSVIARNLEKLSYGHSLSNFTFHTHMALSILGVLGFCDWARFELAEMARCNLRVGYYRRRAPIVRHVMNLKGHSVQSLPRHLKEQVRVGIQKVIADVPSFKLLPLAEESFITRLSEVIKFMDGADLFHEIGPFVRRTKALDGMRGQSFTKLFPEFQEVFDMYPLPAVPEKVAQTEAPP